VATVAAMLVSAALVSRASGLTLIRNLASATVLIDLREESFKLLESLFVYAYDVPRNVVYPFLIALSLDYYLTTRHVLLTLRKVFAREGIGETGQATVTLFKGTYGQRR
jgi:hypothetical protein